MREIENEIDRIKRRAKGVELGLELRKRLRLEEERNLSERKRQEAIVLREVRKTLWEIVESFMRKSKK